MPGADGVDALHAIIANMESERSKVLRVLAGSHGTDAESIAKTLKLLDAKLEAARAKRDELGKRLARAQRMAEVTGELRRLRSELEALTPAGRQGERYEGLKQRVLVLQAEAASLLASKAAV